MSKKSVSKSSRSEKEQEFIPHFNDIDHHTLSDFMDDAIEDMNKSIESDQKIALELTKLALAHCKNADENTVFDLFSRSAELVDELYNGHSHDDHDDIDF